MVEMVEMKKVIKMREKKVVGVTFDPADFERIKEYAKANGISITGFIRMHALRAVSKGE